MIPFILEHQLKAKRLLNETAPHDPEALVFETCMRKIEIRPWGAQQGANQKPGMEGAKAYQFLLEVLTGLESPVFGETEVFSQFKDFWERQQKGNMQAHYFAPWAKSIIEDTKKLRSEFFREGTAATWGGVVRKQLRPFPEVLIVGNGQLAVSVATAIKGSEVSFWARTKKPELNGKHIQWGTPAPAANGPRALVVAAPLSDEEMCELLRQKGHLFDWVADLREIKEERPASLAAVDLDLQSIEAESEMHKKRVADIRHRAQKRIIELANKSYDSLWHRPFGWEDLCG